MLPRARSDFLPATNPPLGLRKRLSPAELSRNPVNNLTRRMCSRPARTRHTQLRSAAHAKAARTRHQVVRAGAFGAVYIRAAREVPPGLVMLPDRGAAGRLDRNGLAVAERVRIPVVRHAVEGGVKALASVETQYRKR